VKIEELGEILLRPEKRARIWLTEGEGIRLSLLFVSIFSGTIGFSLSSSTLISLRKISIPSEFLRIELIESVVGNAMWFSISISVLLFLALGFISWAIWSVSSHVFAVILGGKGSFSDTLSSIGFSWVATFPIPLSIFLFSPLGILGPIISLIFFGALSMVWQLFVVVSSLREVHGIDVIASLISALSPIVVLLLMSFFLLISALQEVLA